ncbi:hypothetical protein LINGRAHAP2_LOCUS24512 [Linum grandiflorum]
MINYEELMWVCVLKALYFPTCSFYEAHKGRSASWIWSSLCEARQVLNLGVIRNMESGRNINLQQFTWIPNNGDRNPLLLLFYCNCSRPLFFPYFGISPPVY